MDLAKINLFKKLQDTTPIGLSSLGLQKINKKINKKSKVYPTFCFLDKILPVAI